MNEDAASASGTTNLRIDALPEGDRKGRPTISISCAIRFLRLRPMGYREAEPFRPQAGARLKSIRPGTVQYAGANVSA
jgi:hypothetical protein